MTGPPAPDWAAAARHLAAAGHRLDCATPPVRLAGGLANRNYRVRLDGRPAVFRCPPPGPLAAGASDMAREARVLEALHPAFPLAPRLLHACLDPEVIGVPFLLIAWRRGVAIGATVPAPHDREAADWMPRALVSTMAAIHRLDPEALGLGGLGRPAGFAARQLAGWQARAAAAFGADRPPALDALLARLAASVPPDAPACLLHMDLKFDNLLLDLAARRVRAVIDWDMGTRGPPAFDLAVLLSYWIGPDDPPAVKALRATPALAPGWPGRAAVAALYAAAAGGLPPDLGWHLALARLRLATAWMQLYRLWQRGALAGPRYGGFAALAAAVLAHALDRFGDVA